MKRAFVTRLRLLRSQLGFERDWKLIVIAACIGVVMAGVAMAFMRPLRMIEEWSADAPRSTLIWIVWIAPAVGALLATFAILAARKGDVREQAAAHAPGVSSVLYAVHRLKGKLPWSVAVRKWIASTLTIGSGGSAGAEGPIVTIGSAIGSSIARSLRSNPQNTATLLGCAAAAGIASVFNAPIAGIFFVLEIILRDFSLRTFTPIVIASVVSAATTQSILRHHEPLFLVGPSVFEEGYQFTLPDIPNYLLLGIVCGAVAAAFIRAMIKTEDLFAAARIPALLKPSIGALMLGSMGLIYMLTFPTDHPVPPFYGNGYPVIRELIDINTYELESATFWSMMALAGGLATLVILKGVATCLTLGSGGSGGMFAPSLLVGAAAGGAFGQLVNTLNIFPAANPAHYALVGMAAMVAATAHAPLTGILLVYEVTLRYEIILPLMLTAVISTIVGRLLFRESVYTYKLTQLGVRLGALSDLTLLRRLSVNDVPLEPALVVRADDAASKLLELSETHLVRDFIVLDDQEQYIGVVTGDDLAAALVYREAIPLLQVHELQRVDLPTVTPDETLDVVLDKFAKHDVQSLAVLDGSGDGSVRGRITRTGLMERYQSALSKDQG